MSRILDNVHASAKRLHDKGRIDDLTMWEFDSLCLPPKRTFSAEDV
jgi:putative transcriptional regulator